MPRWAIIVIVFLLLSIATGVRENKPAPRPSVITERTYDSIAECEADPAAVACYEK